MLPRFVITFLPRSKHLFISWLQSLSAVILESKKIKWDCYAMLSHFSCVWLFATPWTTAHQASLPITNSQSPPKPISVKSVMSSNHLIPCRPLLLLPSVFPSIRVFTMRQLFESGGQRPKYWSFSFSISPSNDYSGWFPLGLTALISLQSKGLSRVFSNTTVQKHQFFSTQPSLWSSSHIHTWPLEKP